MEKATPKGTVQVWGPIADPGPLGLGGLGLTFFMFSLHSTGWTIDFVWITLAIFYGGAAQFIAGMLEFPRNNVLGATAYSTYGSYFLALAFYFLLYTLPSAQFHSTSFTAEQVLASYGWFITGFFACNTYFLICSTQQSLSMFTVFFLLEWTQLCHLIGCFLGQTAGMPGSWIMAGGYFGFFSAIAAFYASFALTWNALAGREMFPLGPVLVRSGSYPPPYQPTPAPASTEHASAADAVGGSATDAPLLDKAPDAPPAGVLA